MALRVIKVGWHGNNRLRHLFAQEGLGISLDLAQNHGAYFFWCIFFIAQLDGNGITLFDDLVWHNVEIFLDFFVGEFAANQALDAIDCVLRVGHTLALRHLPHKALTFFVDCYH